MQRRWHRPPKAPFLALAGLEDSSVNAVLEVEGVRYVDWLTDFIAGEAIDDLVCTDCGAPS